MEQRDDRDDRIAKLEAEAARSEARAVAREEHIAELDARAVLRDDRIVELMREVDGLTTKAESADVINQAKGVIMSTMRCSADAAFAVLVAQSQRENRKVRDVAAEIAGMQDRAT